MLAKVQGSRLVELFQYMEVVPKLEDTEDRSIFPAAPPQQATLSVDRYF